jgi:hypothetical protein
LVTTLLDAELYPLEALAELYRQRWQAELHLRDLKITMNMDVLKCKTVDGVLKEIHVFALVYNLVRVVLQAAARRQHMSIARLSHVDAFRWLGSAHEGEALPTIVVNPDRPDRVEPRVVKRRPAMVPGTPYSIPGEFREHHTQFRRDSSSLELGRAARGFARSGLANGFPAGFVGSGLREAGPADGFRWPRGGRLGRAGFRR